MINMPSASARIFVYALGLTIALCVGAWVGYQPGAVRAERAERALAMAQRDAAQQVALAQEQARAAERRMTERLAAVEARYRQEIEDARATGERVAADLRAGNLRLRSELAALAAAGVSSDPSAAVGADEAARRGAAIAGAAIGVGRECDARIEALIEAYEAAKNWVHYREL